MDFDVPVLFRFFDESLDSVTDGPTDFNLAIANSVVWACAVDEALQDNLGDLYTAARDADDDGRTLFGLRLSRNAILHGQTFAIQPEGIGYPIEYPRFYGPPLWKSYAELTRHWTPRNRGPGLDRMIAAYDHGVARKELTAPLFRSHDWLHRMRERGWSVEP